MNNSWGCPASELCAEDTLKTIIENTTAAGIFVNVSAGNSGPNCSTVNTPPSHYAASYSTGALITGTNQVVGFSSRGPVTVDGSNRIKPDIVAPGASARAPRRMRATPSYASFQGTSMASPHVVGVVALLWQAVPSLSRDIAGTKARLNGTANPNMTVKQRHAVRWDRLDPEQPLRVRPRRRPVGRPGRRASTTATSASATTTSSSTSAAASGGNWVNVAPLPQTCLVVRLRLTAPSLRVRRLPFPGVAGFESGYGLDRYNIATDAWSTLAPDAEQGLVASAVYYPPTNKFYDFGGSTRTPDPVPIVDNVTRIYDVATNTWTMGPNMPAPRSQMASGYNAANGKIYLHGGYRDAHDRQRAGDLTWEFDTVANTFTLRRPTARPPTAGAMLRGSSTAICTWPVGARTPTRSWRSLGTTTSQPIVGRRGLRTCR